MGLIQYIIQISRWTTFQAQTFSCIPAITCFATGMNENRLLAVSHLNTRAPLPKRKLYSRTSFTLHGVLKNRCRCLLEFPLKKRIQMCIFLTRLKSEWVLCCSQISSVLWRWVCPCLTKYITTYI